MPARSGVGIQGGHLLGLAFKSKQAECHEHYSHYTDYYVDTSCHGTPPFFVSFWLMVYLLKHSSITMVTI